VAVSLLDRISARTVDRPTEKRFNIDGWLSDFLLPANEFSFNNQSYPFGLNTTWTADRSKEISNTLPGYMAALRSCPPAFGAQLVRASVLSQARFCFRNADWSPKAGRTFTTSALGPLQKPWQNATTGQLINLMEWHHGLAGNAYVTNRTPGRLRVLRPDWVVIMYGSQQQPDDAAHALDGELIGYGYCNGGIAQGKYPIETLLPGEVAHWSAEQDPECAGIGMSWITPAIREIQGDKAATDHKLRFFENGATPNMVVKGINAATKEQFDEFVDMMETRHAGVRNAYRTLYLTTGADATVVGADLKQIDFKATQGAGETRISMLSRVHPVILGASEGLQGSSLNAGNFGAARRLWADTWIYPTLQDLAASLASMVRVPSDAELWTNTKDMPILREDARDAADIEQVKASTIVSLSTGGFTRESAIAAVMSQDMSLLVKDPNWVSVQLQQSDGQAPAGGAGPKVPALRADSDDELDEDSLALLAALDELSGDARAFNPDQPRGPDGKWVAMVDRLKNALKEHHEGGGKGDPFEGFSREQLRRVAKARGIDLKRGEGRDSIAKKLLDHLGTGKPGPEHHESKTPKVALTGEQALEAAPIKVAGADFERGVEGDLAQEIDPDALSMYRGDYYVVINDDLRANDWEGSDSEWTIRTIDTAMENSKLTQDVMVHRGVKDMSLFRGVNTDESLVGLEYIEDAYSSTTADKAVTEEFWAPGGAIINLRVPAGVGAIQLSDFGPPPEPGHERPVTDEAELLLQRGLRVRITGDRVVNRIRELDAEVVPA
jgi:phage portal protein BeeE